MEIIRKDGRTDFKIHGSNQRTGMFAVEWNGDKGNITIYKQSDKPVSAFNQEWAGVRMGCKVGSENQVMYKYGKSKTIHWNNKCAKPNTDAAPIEIGLLEGILSGHSECRNCWGRTRCIQ